MAVNPGSKKKWVNQREFAELVGMSRPLISNYVQQGRLPVDEDGRIHRTKGLQAWESIRKIGFENSRWNALDEDERVEREALEYQLSEKLLPEQLQMDGHSRQAVVGQMYNEARARREIYKARILELEYREETRRLVPKEKVEEDAKNTAIMLRQQLLGLGSRVSSQCEGQSSARIAAIIRDEVNTILAGLQGLHQGDEP